MFNNAAHVTLFSILNPYIEDEPVKEGTGGNVYFIDPGGDDITGTGSYSNPWLTLQHACSVVTRAGDWIHVNAGNYTETLSCVLAEGVNIQGDGATLSIITSNDFGAAFHIIYAVSAIENSLGNRISHIGFDGDSENVKNAIYSRRRGKTIISYCDFYDFAYQAINMCNGPGTGAEPTAYASGCAIHHCNIYNCSQESAGTALGSIEIGGQVNLQIYSNSVICPLSVADHGIPIKGVNYPWHKGLLIHHNTLQKFANATDLPFCCELWDITGGFEFYSNTCTGALDMVRVAKYTYSLGADVHHNSFSRPALYDRDDPGVTLERSCSDVNIYKNYFANLPQGINISGGGVTSTLTRINIFYNIFYNIGTASDLNNYRIIYCYSPDLGHTWSYFNFYNNVMLCKVGGATDCGIFLPQYGTCSYFMIKNNIIENGFDCCIWGRGVGSTMDHLSIDNNLFNNNGAADQPLFDFGYSPTNYTYLNNIETDNPDFVNPASDWHLQAGSPCIDAGVNVGLTTDYEDDPVADPPEIGAYEY